MEDVAEERIWSSYAKRKRPDGIAVRVRQGAEDQYVSFGTDLSDTFQHQGVVKQVTLSFVVGA